MVQVEMADHQPFRRAPGQRFSCPAQIIASRKGQERVKDQRAPAQVDNPRVTVRRAARPVDRRPDAIAQLF
jgi:hypothetical protein